MALIDFIEAERIRQNLTVKELTALTNGAVDRFQYSKWFNKVYEAKDVKLVALADALGCEFVLKKK